MTPDERFRRADEYAANLGFSAAFPNFYEADYGKGPVGGVHFLRSNVVEWRDVPAAELGNPPLWDIPALFRAANDYASRNGFFTGFPNCQTASRANGRVFGIQLIKSGAAEWRDVPKSSLGNPDINNVPAMMKAAASYASANGFDAAFPNFHQARSGRSVVYGHILFPRPSVEGRDVSIGDLQPRDEKTCVILCRFRDNAGGLTPVLKGQDFYERYFFGRRNDSLADFFRTASNYRTNVWGKVYDWIDIGHTVSELQSFGSNQTQRRAAHNWGIEAARANGIPVDSYTHRAVIVSSHCDFGGIGRAGEIGGSGDMVMPHAADDDLPYKVNFHSYMQHEFGHLVGNDHSYDQTGPYLDPYCIMSFATRQHTAIKSIAGLSAQSGCGLNAAYASNMGGMPPHRRIDYVPSTTSATGLFIIPQGYPEIDAAQAIRIPPDKRRTSTYWISYRHPSRWDAGIGAPSVVVHEVRARESISRLVPGPRDSALQQYNDEVITPDGLLRIRLAGFVPGGTPMAWVYVYPM